MRIQAIKKPFALALVLLLLSSCGSDSISASLTVEESPSEQSISTALLPESEDLGKEYLNGFVFLGESTTYHLKSRGVLTGGTQTKQVWGPDNGTILLDSAITTLRIRYPETGESLTVGEAVARKKPKYLLLTFGLNGAPGFIKRGSEAFKSAYRSLLDAVRSASPDTQIILQSCFPIAANMDMSRYSITVDELNAQIDTINGWSRSLAEEYGIYYLNTAEILKDEAGRLKDSYQCGDGYHLTREAYLEILKYIRTHGCPKEAL